MEHHRFSVNGPSVIEVPSWLPDRRGKYYMYFGHHTGDSVRLAASPSIRGPWQMISKSVLRKDPTSNVEKNRTICSSHIASPDAIVDHLNRRIVLFTHGCAVRGTWNTADEPQCTKVATSTTGLTFGLTAVGQRCVAGSYLRSFEHEGRWYGIRSEGGRSRSSKLYRSDWMMRATETQKRRPFEDTGRADDYVRHVAVVRADAETVRIIRVHACICTHACTCAWADRIGDLVPLTSYLMPACMYVYHFH